MKLIRLFKGNSSQRVVLSRTLESTIFEMVFLVLAIAFWASVLTITEYSSYNKLIICLILTVVGVVLLVSAYFPQSVNMPVSVSTPRQCVLAGRMTRVVAIEMLLLAVGEALYQHGVTHLLLVSCSIMIIITCILFSVFIYLAK